MGQTDCGRKPKTISTRKMSVIALRKEAALYPETFARPICRGDCEHAERPCPFVGCKYHLYLDINSESGSIKYNFPGMEPSDLKHSCALDIADRSGLTLEEVADLMNLTRERIRQLEMTGLRKIKEVAEEQQPEFLDMAREILADDDQELYNHRRSNISLE